MVQNANTSFIFRPSVYRLATMIAYHVQITTKVSEYGYDLEIKGQSQIFLKLSHCHNTNSSLLY